MHIGSWNSFQAVVMSLDFRPRDSGPALTKHISSQNTNKHHYQHFREGLLAEGASAVAGTCTTSKA